MKSIFKKYKTKTKKKSIFKLAPTALQMYPFGKEYPDPDDEALYQSPIFKRHSRLVVGMLDEVVDMLGPDLGPFTLTLADSGARHVDYGVLPAHYGIVGAALLSTLQTALGPTRWTSDVEKGWKFIFEFISTAMISGMEHKVQRDRQRQREQQGSTSKTKSSRKTDNNNTASSTRTSGKKDKKEKTDNNYKHVATSTRDKHQEDVVGQDETFKTKPPMSPSQIHARKRIEMARMTLSSSTSVLASPSPLATAYHGKSPVMPNPVGRDTAASASSSSPTSPPRGGRFYTSSSRRRRRLRVTSKLSDITGLPARPNLGDDAADDKNDNDDDGRNGTYGTSKNVTKKNNNDVVGNKKKTSSSSSKNKKKSNNTKKEKNMKLPIRSISTNTALTASTSLSTRPKSSSHGSNIDKMASTVLKRADPEDNNDDTTTNDDDNDNTDNHHKYNIASVNYSRLIEVVYMSWDKIKAIPNYEQVAGVLLFRK